MDNAGVPQVFVHRDDQTSLPLFQCPSSATGHMGHTNQMRKSCWILWAKRLSISVGFHRSQQPSQISKFWELEKIQLQLWNKEI